MSFNSLEFLFFLGASLLVFQAAKKNILFSQIYITLISFIFYLAGDPSFFPYLLALGLMNFAFARAIVFLPAQKKILLIIIVVVDCAFLLGAKVYGQSSHYFPLGVSFFTFQILSFILDIYSARIPFPKNIWHFLSYMFFFPHLIAGPICRAGGLMKQLATPFGTPSFAQVRSGFYLISFGLLKKAVIADTIASRINEVFHTPQGTQGILAWGVVIFTYGWQIYFDFSGYSDIARGIGKLFGLDLPLNFSFPYFSHSLQNFWRRWHMTLSLWFRDFVYLPLGGSKESPLIYVTAILITFLLSSIWHGLGLNYLIWGLWHAFWLIVFHFSLNNFPIVVKRLITLFVIFSGWLFFRSESLDQIQVILGLVFTSPSQTWINSILIKSDLIFLSAGSLLVEIGAFQFKKRYQAMSLLKTDAVWLLVTLCSLIFQAPIKEFIYARF